MNDFKLMLAPLEDTTDNVFRELCYNHGADLTFTEMTRLDGLIRKNKSTQKKIELLSSVPVQIQLAAQKETDLKSFLENFKPTVGFLGFNLNLGCPSPEVVRQGLGIALIKRISKVERLVKIVKSYNYPCSIKMRLGGNAYEKLQKVYLKLLNNVDADFFAIHARHGIENYESKADYSVFSECVATGKVIIANGDIDSVKKVNYLKKIGVQGVMLGRIAVIFPFIFERFKGLKETSIEDLKLEYEALAKKYVQTEKKYYNNVMTRMGVTKNNFSKSVMG